jgi:hypothetical protein
LEQEANVEHPSLAKLEREKKLFLIDLAESLYSYGVGLGRVVREVR